MNTKPTVFITGAAKGIGAQTALMFSKQGYRVAATDANEKDLQKLKKSLGSEHFYRQLDVTWSDDFDAALKEFAAENGGVIDILINNAGIAFIDNFENVPLDKHLTLTDVNIKGVLIGAFHALKYLTKSSRPTMISLCSLSSEYGVPSEASYSASKFWVKGFTEAMNIEWDRYGIYVCDIMPNFVATPMMQDLDGKIVKSIGIRLNANDVSATIWKAVQNRKRIHWEVDTWRPRLLRALNKLLPKTLRRSAMKHLSGY